MLFAALRDTFRLLRERSFRRLGLISALLSLALLVAALALVMLVYGSIINSDGPASDLDGALPETGLLDLIGLQGIAVLLVTSMGLMVPVAAVFGALSINEIAARIEKLRWNWPAPVVVPVAMRDSANFTGLLITANVFTLAGTLLLMKAIGPAGLFLWYLVNGWLLGREYFTLTARRHLGDEALHALRRAHRGRIWVAGTLMALPLSLPVVNLAVPFLGAAWFTHFFHRLRAG